MRRLLFVAGMFGLLACGEDGPKFSVNYAPGFQKDGAAMSVFGVFKDGRMDPEAWDDLAPKFTAALHRPDCESAVSAGLRSSKPDVYSAVDDTARRDGITDSLLAKFAPAAKGDSILVVTVSGRLPPRKQDGSEPVSTTETTQGRMGGMGGGGRGRAGGPAKEAAKKEPDKPILEISASLYSKRLNASAAMVSMTYQGDDPTDAVNRFVAKFQAAFPGATSCAGWDPAQYANADALRSQ